MKLLKKINKIQWKYVAGANAAVLVLALTFVSMQPATQSTDTRSQAKEALPSPLVKPVIDPLNHPELLSTDPDWAKVGDALVVKGKNLGRVPYGTLWLGEIQIPYENIVDWQPEQIVFTVPPDAVTSVVTLRFTSSSGKLYELTTKNPITIRETNL